ncbi:FERM central domain protein [Dictyocaulus viviparus]|uniref:FERM central domain protein n=1 Tax=Dictyocaulus viviparus TaxID=29172 RepID=A0A0D8Y5I1_DICVI|nr:FERM central domain protein [Dictyocaulus viviparus]
MLRPILPIDPVLCFSIGCGVQTIFRPKECPKYLSGYHKVIKQEAVELATLILRAIMKESTNAPLAQIPQLLNKLVPKDMMSLVTANEWRKLISSAYVKVEHITSDQAKIEFLTIISRKETFGSAFFLYSFNEICNWTSGNTYFNIVVENDLRNNKGKKLLLDTTMGYKMDDLITSYISFFISKQTSHSSRKQPILCHTPTLSH